MKKSSDAIRMDLLIRGLSFNWRFLLETLIMTLSDPGATILLMAILLKKGVSFQYATVSFNV